MTSWHDRDAALLAQELSTDTERGLSESEARRRLREIGENALPESATATWPQLLRRQFADLLIWILAGAALLSLAIGEWLDAVTIASILVLNGALGFVQEWRAEQALAALRQMLTATCTVIRSGSEAVRPTTELVPGDVVILAPGDQVPADLRLLEARGVCIDESALTGESAPVEKTPRAVSSETPLAERRSMAWMGTAVSEGRARGVVVATGLRTEFGRIAELTESVDRAPTPLQRAFADLGRRLGFLGLAVAGAVAVTGALLGQDWILMMMTGISLAVAVVPEGLPAVVTVTLGLGVRAMARRRALLRRLAAAETLGSASVICTDKTGTLTQNEMTLREVWLAAGSVVATGSGYDPAGHWESDGARLDLDKRPDLQALLETGLRCNHAHLRRKGEDWFAIGEPTEVALVVGAYKAWLDPEACGDIELELPFSSSRKCMSVVEKTPERSWVHHKGAPELVLERCTQIQDGESTRRLTPDDLERATQAYRALASRGLRALALARRELETAPAAESELEQGLTFLGLVGILDPPRPEVPAAIATARAAGVRVIMITGDSPETATAIAERIGLSPGKVVTGTDVDQMDAPALSELLEGEVLFARTTPEHKLLIVEQLQAAGNVVAMTGDGVNDAPALKRADIGIAMGRRGTDVAKSASELVLTDDNFASIVSAIEEGRRQFDNIQKFVVSLLSSNAGEVIAIFGCLILGAPLILIPVQILWVNLVTDGVSAIALGMEPPEPGVMSRPPRDPKAGILSGPARLQIAWLGLFAGALTLGVFMLEQLNGGALIHARTLAFSLLVWLEQVNALNFRSLRTSLFQMPWASNPTLLVAIALMMGLQVVAVHVPPVQAALGTTDLSLGDWVLVAVAGASIVVVGEGIKLGLRRTEARRGL